MRILIVADTECPSLWDYGTPEKLKDIDLILSCGDVKADYLSYLVTLARCPLLYVHGNHDEGYDRKPPEGCDCIDDAVVCYRGIRIAGIDGCRRYKPGPYQYTEAQMRRKLLRLRLKADAWKGVDILLTHCPAQGLGDGEDYAHRGFACFLPFLKRYQPSYFIHGHEHLNYSHHHARLRKAGETTVVNGYERYILEIPDAPYSAKHRHEILRKAPVGLGLFGSQSI